MPGSIGVFLGNAGLGVRIGGKTIRSSNTDDLSEKFHGLDRTLSASSALVGRYL